MTKLIINTRDAAAYASVISAFIRYGFAVDEFTIYNQTLIIEISNYQDIAIGKCNITTITQSIYEIVTAVSIDNITMRYGNTSFTINAYGCYAATESVVSLDCVYDAVSNVLINRIKSMRSEDLSKCYAIVQAEQLAEDIAANIQLRGCQKRKYCIDYTQYDAVTLCDTLAQLGIKSYIKSNTRNLIIV